MDFIKGSYAQLVDLIIRPPRYIYEEEELGPKTFRIGTRRFQRNDFTILNDRGNRLHCSHFEPAEDQRPRGALPCIIYLHGNSGCRLDALHTLEIVLPYNITLFCLDLSGSGLSEGDFISLGYYERHDVACIVNHLRESGRVSGIGIWGRSMGAATAIMYAAMDPSIACLVLDSPFCSLNVVAQELVENSQIKIPKMMVSLGLKLIRKTIKSKAKFDINKLEPQAHVESAFTPALFVHAEGDNFILPHHSQGMQKRYAGDSNLIMVEGDHNSPRPEFCYDSITIFFHNTLLVGEDRLPDNFSLEHLGMGGGFGSGMEDLSGYVRRHHEDVDLIASLNNLNNSHHNTHNIIESPPTPPRKKHEELNHLQLRPISLAPSPSPIPTEESTYTPDFSGVRPSFPLPPSAFPDAFLDSSTSSTPSSSVSSKTAVFGYQSQLELEEEELLQQALLASMMDGGINISDSVDSDEDIPLTLNRGTTSTSTTPTTGTPTFTSTSAPTSTLSSTSTSTSTSSPTTRKASEEGSDEKKKEKKEKKEKKDRKKISSSGGSSGGKSSKKSKKSTSGSRSGSSERREKKSISSATASQESSSAPSTPSPSTPRTSSRSHKAEKKTRRKEGKTSSAESSPSIS